MKLKIAVFFVLGAIVFSACSKKQCPAYGSNTQQADATEVKA